ncbi:DinB family protein [Luteipulveratus mongoliensis]|uniref:Mini-circle protein n=1 Tax=Luteipulveratus mongoliensis TaxID=571913 RepID=A0A0K1JEQ3_9MICO|nr:DinB family protein [Luteipulveratus mongoliensis]AKU15073.1 mini-circle protein [Luteipulveratus mongoliensis]
MSTTTTYVDAEFAGLATFLTAQRESVLAIVEGLDEAALRKAVVPSGWTPLGMVEHLCGAERYWFQHVVRGQMDPRPWPPSDEDAFVSEQPVEAVMAFYRATCTLSDEIMRATSLEARPVGEPHPDLAHYAADVRTVVLHMIEETARHAGHLDIARELLDGSTGLGPR